MTFLLLTRQYISLQAHTFLWRFLQTRKIRTTSKMAPSPTMMTGKLDTTVTISRSVFIWAADSSSIVAVWKFSRKLINFEQKYLLSEGSTNDTRTHLIDIHNGENCLIEEFCFAEKEKVEISLAFFLLQNILQWFLRQFFYLREARDSLQYDVKLSSLTGTNGNPCSLRENKKTKGQFTIKSQPMFTTLHTVFARFHPETTTRWAQ